MSGIFATTDHAMLKSQAKKRGFRIKDLKDFFVLDLLGAHIFRKIDGLQNENLLQSALTAASARDLY